MQAIDDNVIKSAVGAEFTQGNAKFQHSIPVDAALLMPQVDDQLAKAVLCVTHIYFEQLRVQGSYPELSVIQNVRERFVANLTIDLYEGPVFLRVEEAYAVGHEMPSWVVLDFDVAIDSQIAIYLVANLAG